MLKPVGLLISNLMWNIFFKWVNQMQYQHMYSKSSLYTEVFCQGLQTIFFLKHIVIYRYEKDSAEEQIMPSRECYHFRYFKSILVFPCFKQCFYNAVLSCHYRFCIAFRPNRMHSSANAAWLFHTNILYFPSYAPSWTFWAPSKAKPVSKAGCSYPVCREGRVSRVLPLLEARITRIQ